MATADPDHPLLTIAEAADAARISRRHLQALLQRNEGPPVIRLGRRLVIRRAALTAWLLAREAAHVAA
jgi:excisionase family DNA binding protein